MNIAVVTGASSGLGREFVYLLDAVGLDEIWVTARRKDRLLALQKQTHTTVHVFSGDICHSDTIESLIQAFEKEKPVVSYLIYAAGLGRVGAIEDISITEQQQMIRVNCEGAVTMTGLCMPYMKAGGHIVEVCSVASFQPLPYFAVYAVTKAFLYHYSLALAVEMEAKGIAVTAVCPYWVKDTEFIPLADTSNHTYHFRHYPFAGITKKVARQAWQDIQKRKRVSTPGWPAFFLRMITALIPNEVILWFCRFF